MKHLGLDVKCHIFLSDFIQIWIFSTDFFFIAFPKIKIHVNPSSWGCADKSGLAETVGHCEADSDFSPKDLQI